MRIEVEIQDEAIKESVQSDISRAIQQRAYRWGQEEEIRKLVNQRWEEVVPKLIQDRLENSQLLNEMIDEEVKRQIKSKIAKLVKAAEGK